MALNRPIFIAKEITIASGFNNVVASVLCQWLTFRQPFDLLAVANTAWQREKAAGANSSDLRPIWLPTVDTLRNLFYAPTLDMKITFELLRQGRLGGFGRLILEGV
jgi:hypothetical protein